MNIDLTETLERAARCERLSDAQAIALATVDPAADWLHRLGTAARRNRCARFGDRATYVFNLQINPSNVCEGRCRFCRFSVEPGSADAYELSETDILDRIRDHDPVETHIVGGLNRSWGFRRSLELVRAIRRIRPHIHIKGFTAVEMDWFARCERLPIEDVLNRFRDAGLEAMPGGGAEVFSPRVRRLHCPV